MPRLRRAALYPAELRVHLWPWAGQFMPPSSKIPLVFFYTDFAPLPLPAVLGALGAQWRDGRLSISFDPATSNAVDILQKVQLAGFEVSDISTAESDLEDVFLSLTK